MMNVSPKKNFLLINLFKILFIFVLVCFSLFQVYIKAEVFKYQDRYDDNFKYQRENINKVIEEVNKSSNLKPTINLNVKVKKSIINLVNDLVNKLIDVVSDKSLISGYIIKFFKPIILFTVNSFVERIL
ncbi:MAG: hypothetical protein ACLTFB_00635 [Candidatus Phytoplasma pyri]|uniref:hypothetical protein n=1 Tax=Candidatus Phytoplasma pyri TaxID=47566 RepID=UPI003983C257